MKRIINISFPTMLAVLLAALQGCTKSAYEEPSDDAVLVINATLDHMKLSPAYTRAVEDIKLYDKLFTVVGFKTENDNLFEDVKSSITPNLYGGTQFVKPQIDERGRLVTNPKTWTSAVGSSISFFAFSDNTPASPTYGITSHSDQNTAGYPWLDIKLQPAPYSADGTLQQGDIVAAQVMDEPNFIIFSAIDMNFNHILSKISFQAFSSTQAKIRIYDFTYSATNLYTQGRFTFNGANKGAPGSFSNLSNPVTTSNHRIYPAAAPQPEITPVNNSSATSIALGDALFIPQNVTDGYLELAIKYSIEISPGNWSAEMTKSIPLRSPQSGNIAPGAHYLYTIDFALEEISISVEGIEDWNIDRNTLPIVFGPRGDVLVEYHANEAPYMTNDGTKWVLDHSGYNRHGRIVGAVNYNVSDKSYEFTTDNGGTTANAYIEVPDIPGVQEATIEMVMKSPMTTGRGKDGNNAFTFNLPSGMHYVSFNYTSNTQALYFRSSNVSSVYLFRTLSKELYNDYSLWTFCRAQKFELVSRNDNAQIMSSIDNEAFTIGALNSGKIGYNFGGNIRYFRLTKSGTDMAQIESRYAKLKSEYKIPGTIRPTATIYNNDGTNLVARFKKSQEPFYDANGDRYWEDLSGNGNHLWISPGVTRITGTDGHYYFDGNNTYMKFVRKLPITRNLSFYKQVSSEPSTGENRVILHMATTDNTLSHNTPLIQYFPIIDNGTPRLWGYSYNERIPFDDFQETQKADKPYMLNYINDVSYEFGQPRFLIGGEVNSGGSLSNYTTRTYTGINYVYIGCAANKTCFYKGKIHDLILYNTAFGFSYGVECDAAKVYRFERDNNGTQIYK